MPLYVYLAAAMVCAGFIVLVASLSGMRAPAQLTRSNLANTTARVTNLREVVLARPSRERLIKPAAQRMANAARRITPRGFAEQLDQRIHQAGIAEHWPVDRVLAAKLLLGGIGAAIGVLRLVTEPSAASVILLVAASLVGFLVPDLLVSMRASERQENIQRELPDILDQVTICVEAGLGFEAALARAARPGASTLSSELARALQDIRLGMSRRVALEKLLERTDVADLRHFVVAISQAERRGLPIANVLRVQADELREKRRQRAEEQAMKIPVKLVFPLVLCILPALFIVLLGPAAIRISESSFGG
jgi:tight adherence protein C